MATAEEHDGMRIAVVAELLGIPVPTIRSWERRYDFPTPSRTGGRHRRYGAAEVSQLRALRDLITKGHSTRDAVAQLRRSTAAAVDDGSGLARVLEAALALDSTRLRAELDAAAETRGVEHTVQQVILPAMREIGARWRAGRCDVGREHLASEVVRSWLSRQAFLAPPAYRPRPIVLAAGPQDQHTIGLEAFAVILARRGWPCRVLGARTPADALAATLRSLDAAAAVVTAQRAVTRRSAITAIEAAHAVAGVRVCYAGDAFAAQAARQDVAGTYLGHDLLEAAEIIEHAAQTGSASGRSDRK